MQLFLMRHGEASFDAPSDRERTLTHHGRYQSGQVGEQLNSRISQLDLVLVSPYLRAQQTWQVVSKHLPKAQKCVVLDDITPSGDPKSAADVILAYAEQYKAETVLVITHMPIVGFLVSELVAGEEAPIFATSAFVQIDKHMENASLIDMNLPQVS
ncbi:phosphohistidine phosphatase SixA [Shewanella gaetbuli]|uniref:Phosphohistidine phosphatase SixA n=1 Tax=Shewanella gaetbuli TaxID=220752 RepID=A0A9X1ZM85_9GAMM|nr:phosphohistidine phosphatase SixA [Shewanella gaetbuli]MCL1143577.1 phosphohistidine phosphatase SixA [Shewanella gaetbuli]